MLRLLQAFVGLILCSVVNSQNLEQNFLDPPASAKQQTWMHAMDGNMSKVVLTKDLASISDVGIGGVLLFNISQRIPSGRITYNSPEHRDLLVHAAKESESLGLNFGVHNCDGWSASDGPWITPEQSMKMVEHRDTFVKGGKELAVQFPKPTARKNYCCDLAVLAYHSLPSEVNDFQNIPAMMNFVN